MDHTATLFAIRVTVLLTALGCTVVQFSAGNTIGTLAALAIFLIYVWKVVRDV